MADAIPKSNSLGDLAGLLTTLAPIFFGSGKVSTTESGKTTSNVDPALLAQLLGIGNTALSNSGDTKKVADMISSIMQQAAVNFLPTAGLEKQAGLYDSVTLRGLRDNGVANASAAAAKAVLDYQTQQLGIAGTTASNAANLTKGTTTSSSGTKQQAATVDPLMSLGGIAGSVLLNRLLKSDAAGSIFDSLGSGAKEALSKLGIDLGGDGSWIQDSVGAANASTEAIDAASFDLPDLASNLEPLNQAAFFLDTGGADVLSNAEEAIDVLPNFSAGSSVLDAGTETLDVFATSSEALDAGSAASFGSPLSGVGFGMLTNKLLKGNQTYGTVGAIGGTAVGAAIGSAFGPVGTVAGSILGGVLGGGGGGMFGPGKQNAYSSTGVRLKDGRLTIGDSFSQLMDQGSYAERNYSIAWSDAFNSFLDTKNLELKSVGNLWEIGQNTPFKEKDPKKYANFNDAFAGFEFTSSDPNLAKVVEGKTFASVQDLATSIYGIKSTGSRITPKHQDYMMTPEELLANYEDPIVYAGSG